MFDLDEPFYLNQRVWVARPMESIDKNFLFYFISSNIFQENVNVACMWWAQENIWKPELWNISLPLPPLSTQQKIATYLDTETARIDDHIDLIQSSIDLLTEYKHSLISHAVTGKIKVE